jgi:hypothetical protein
MVVPFTITFFFNQHIDFQSFNFNDFLFKITFFVPNNLEVSYVHQQNLTLQHICLVFPISAYDNWVLIYDVS